MGKDLDNVLEHQPKGSRFTRCITLEAVHWNQMP